MKIQALAQVESGIPFYKVKVGEYFKLVSSHNPPIAAVFKKVDEVGAIDYPYDQHSEESTLFIGERTLVVVIKKNSKIFKEYSKEIEELIQRWDDLFLVLKK